jgi:Spy/CpxP family protein refolding chaperone
MKKAACVFAGCLALGVMALNVQVRAQRGERGRGDDRNVSPAEIQSMFDGMALLQAQEQLKLRDDQFSQFLSRFKALQEARRRYQADRGRIIQDLRRLTADPKSDEMQMKDRLKALQDLDGRSPADIRKALDAIDQVLDVRQQAQFRAFEELMERRKIELVVRARQNNRARLRSGGQ